MNPARFVTAGRMIRTARALVLLLLLLSVAASARRRDPLTDSETDQLREAAMEPFKRLQLYIKFTDARLAEIDRLRADAKEARDRGKRIHDLLEDFTALLDEVNDNLDNYQGRPLDKDLKKEFHKGVKLVLAASARWETNLSALRSAVQSDAQSKREFADFRYILQDAEEALKSTSEVAREYAETKDAEPEPKKK